MSHRNTPMSGARDPSSRKDVSVIWLGTAGESFDAACHHFIVFHVTTVDAALHALRRDLAHCLVIDWLGAHEDVVPLIASVREQWPAVSIIVLGGDRMNAPLPDAVHVLPQDSSADVVARVIAEHAGRDDHDAALSDFHALQDRARHLEGLVQASFSFASSDDIQALLGDINTLGSFAVGADSIAVLLADKDYGTLADTLQLGVPEPYITVCQDHLRALDAEQRLQYLGDEVLLRERIPGMLPTAIRMREAQAADAWSYMRLPLIIDNRLAGFVAFFGSSPGQFDGAHLQLGRLFATQVATAIRNTQQYLRLTSAETRQRVVANVAQLLAEDLALDDVLGRIAEQAVLLAQASAGLVLLVEPDRSLTIRAVHNHASALIGHNIPPGTGQAGMIALTARPSIVTEYNAWPHANPALRDHIGNSSALIGVPLIYRGLVLGVLQVTFAQDLPADVQDVRDILVMLAPQAATAIAKAQLHETVRQDQRHLQAILDHTPAGVVVCDPQGTILRANPQALDLFRRLDLPTDNIIGNTIQALSRGLLDTSDEAPAFLNVNQPFEVSLGELGVYMVTVAPVNGAQGAPEAYVGVAQDVTALRRLDLVRANLHRVLTHDLGNLIMLARGPLDLLNEPDLTPDQRDELRAMLSGSLIRMQDLISDVTNLEMADSLGQETFAPYNLGSLVQRVVKRNESNAANAQIALTFEENAAPLRPLLGHAVLINQAVDNLISNAIKYTPAGGRVTVTVGLEADGYARINVEDTGFGIPAEEIDNIFKPFVRIQDYARRDIQGTGLGLSLVKAFVETHGGRVQVSSAPQQGSTFTIILPLDAQSTPHSLNGSVPHLDLSAYVK